MTGPIKIETTQFVRHTWKRWCAVDNLADENVRSVAETVMRTWLGTEVIDRGWKADPDHGLTFGVKLEGKNVLHGSTGVLLTTLQDLDLQIEILSKRERAVRQQFPTCDEELFAILTTNLTEIENRCQELRDQRKRYLRGDL